MRPSIVPALAALAVGLVVLASAPTRARVQSDWTDAEAWTSYASGDEVLALSVSPSEPDRVWAGTDGGGLVAWDRATKLPFQRLFPAADAPAGNRIFDIDHAGPVTWLAGSGGLSRVEGDSWQRFGESEGLPRRALRAVAQGPDGRVWAGNEEGLFVSDGALSGWRSVPPEAFDEVELVDRLGPGALAVQDLIVDADGLLWVTHGAGTGEIRPAFSIQQGDGLWRHVPTVGPDSPSALGPITEQVVAMARAPESASIWMATWGRGLMVYHADIAAWGRHMPPNCGTHLRALALDAGSVWVACGNAYRGLGLARWDGSEWSEWLAEDGLSNTEIASLAVAGDELWIGLDGDPGAQNGILSLALANPDPAAAERLSTSPAAPASNDLTTLAIAPDGALWAGTRGAGLLRRDPQGGEWLRYDKASTGGMLVGDTISDLAFDGHRLWIAAMKAEFDGRDYSQGGISRLDLMSGNWEEPILPRSGGLPDRDVSSLWVAPDSKLWIGLGAASAGIADGSIAHAGNGVAVYDPSADIWRHYDYARDSSGLPGATVLDLGGDAEGRVWAASAYHHSPSDGRNYGGGMARFESDAWQAWRSGEDGLLGWSNGSSGWGSNAFISGDFRSLLLERGGAAWAGSWTIAGNDSLVERWPAVDGALSRFEGGSWESWQLPDAGWVSALAEDGDGRIWAGSTRGHALQEPPRYGPYAKDPESSSLYVREHADFQALDPLSSGFAGWSVTALTYEPATDALWVATENDGLARLALSGIAPPIAPSPTRVLTPTAEVTTTSTVEPSLTPAAPSPAPTALPPSASPEPPNSTPNATPTAGASSSASPPPAASATPSATVTVSETAEPTPTAPLSTPTLPPDEPGALPSKPPQIMRIFIPLMEQRQGQRSRVWPWIPQ